MKYELMAHQKEAVDFAVSKGGIAAFYHEVGVGKTLSALHTYTVLRQSDPTMKMLVICPLSLIYGAWTREINKFTDFSWKDLHNPKTELFFGLTNIHILNFEYLISNKKFEALRRNLSGCGVNWLCVIDESSKMKNHRTKTVDRIHKLKPYLKHRIVMSGTPAPNIEWEYWSQMYFLGEDILGNNFYRFKGRYFSLMRGTQIVPGQFMNRALIRKMHEQGFKYGVVPDKRKEMFARMNPWVHYVKAKDCIDLPEEIDEYRSIELTKDQRRVYKQMKQHYIAELPPGDTVAVANVALTKIMKLRQITSGFAIDDKQKAVLIDTKNPKLDALMDLVEECGDHQMIIWCHFHFEIDMVTFLLEKEWPGSVAQLHGRVKQSDRVVQLDSFLERKTRFLVAHPMSAAHGLTLTNCHIAVFFSLDYSMESYSQARGRIYRKGQKNNCLYFHLIARDTIDEDVLRIVQKKETAREVAERYLIKRG